MRNRWSLLYALLIALVVTAAVPQTSPCLATVESDVPARACSLWQGEGSRPAPAETPRRQAPGASLARRTASRRNHLRHLTGPSVIVTAVLPGPDQHPTRVRRQPEDEHDKAQPPTIYLPATPDSPRSPPA